MKRMDCKLAIANCKLQIERWEIVRDFYLDFTLQREI
jgi:hypothetical protein